MRVAALQFDVRTGDVAHNLARVERGLEDARAAAVELVCLPEMWPTSFLPAERLDEATTQAGERALARIGELSRALELVVCGSAYGAPADPSARPTNRLHVLERGEQRAGYDKVHRFSPTAEGEGFTAGDAPPRVVDTALGRLSGVICYDLRFPEPARAAFLAGAELVVVPAQWPSTRAAHWRALVVGRAVENQCFVVAANRTGSAEIGRRRLVLEFPGNSLVVDPHGVVLAEGRGAEGLVAADVDLAVARELRRRVPVLRDRRPDVYRCW
jgi:predicted amidohydrolase